jgi:hypothetical protein
MMIETIFLNGVQGLQPTLSQARSGLSATSVGKYALFGGGWTGTAPSNVVDIWNSETNIWNVTTFSEARYSLAATSVGKYALFGGGFSNVDSNVVDIWNIQTNTWTVSILSIARASLSATSVRKLLCLQAVELFIIE